MAAVSQGKLNINSRQIPRRSLKDLPSFFHFLSFPVWRRSGQFAPSLRIPQAPARSDVTPLRFDSRGSGWALLDKR
jgi:hypothetical protein